MTVTPIRPGIGELPAMDGEQREKHKAQPPADPDAKLKERFPFETVADLRNEQDVKWLVEGWIAESWIGIIYGAYASGKSFLALDLALHLAYGMKKWHGIKLPGEKIFILVLAREGGQGFKDRIDAFKKYHGITEDPDHLIFMRACVAFDKDDDFNGLKQRIEISKIKFGGVVVDTVGRVLPGAEMMDPKAITLFMERLQQLGELTTAAAIGVHHENKSGGMMGSIYFQNNSDFVFQITREGEDHLQQGTILCDKMKDGRDKWTVSVAYSHIELPGRLSGGSLVVEDIAQPNAAKKEKKTRKKVCQLAMTYYRILYDAGDKGLSLTAWNDAAKDAGLTTKSRLTAYRYELKDAKMVRAYGDIWKVNHNEFL
jgi:AAA domain